MAPSSRFIVLISIVLLSLAAQVKAAVDLFDGKSLSGWIQDPPYATNFSGGDITNLPSFAGKLSNPSDAVSTYIAGQLDDAARSALSAYSPAHTTAKALRSGLAKNLNRILAGPCIFDSKRFASVTLRPDTGEWLARNPTGQDLARLNRMLLEDAYPTDLKTTPGQSWIVKDDAMASTGSGRGVIYIENDYTHYRLLFSMRHISGKPDHPACILIFCFRRPPDQKGLDALGGIQFQVPNGGHWDYRPGHNNGGKGEFTSLPHATFDAAQWSRIEILVDAKKGTARMAVAQPVGGKAVEVLDFNAPEAGRTGPIAWQMHNAGLFDEYKDVSVEVDPTSDDLMTTK